MMRLYHGGPSGHSASVLMALAEKGIEHEDHPVDLAAFEQHGEAFLAINPTGQVPVLEVDGRRLTETFFILLYLDERFPEPALGGADPRARYAVQKWGKYVETHIAPNLALVEWAMRGTLADGAIAGLDRLPPERRALWAKAGAGLGSDEVETARAALAKAVGRIAEDLVGQPWLAGDAYSLADIIVFPHAARLAAAGIDVPAAVQDWLERVRARPHVREALGQGPGRSFVTMGPEKGRWG